MNFNLSPADHAFASAFASGELDPAEFHHREHLRLAYVHLVRSGYPAAVRTVREDLLAFLDHHQVDPKKYHETLTQAWVKAVAHFMDRTERASGSIDFLNQNPAILDSAIMRSHYSRETLQSESARHNFVSPDREPIPAPVKTAH